jgi:uncharacterized membrane protein YccF (DUF307 family)
MRTDNLLGNIIWILFGGLFSAIGYCLGGLLLCLTIIGIPFGLQCFKLAGFVLAPFGKEAISNPSASGCLYLLLNVIWIFTGGIAAALTHIFFGVLLCITIVLIPFGLQHFKLIEISLMPFGKTVVSKS